MGKRTHEHPPWHGDRAPRNGAPSAHTAGIKTDHMGRAGGEEGEAGPPLSVPLAAPRRPRRRRGGRRCCRRCFPTPSAAADQRPPETSRRLARPRLPLPPGAAPSLTQAQPRSSADSVPGATYPPPPPPPRPPPPPLPPPLPPPPPPLPPPGPRLQRRSSLLLPAEPAPCCPRR